MKFTITMKDPDGPYDCIREAAVEAVQAIEGIDEDERKQLIESRHEKFREVCSKWMRWGEYLDFEIDTEAQTIRVLEAKQS